MGIMGSPLYIKIDVQAEDTSAEDTSTEDSKAVAMLCRGPEVILSKWHFSAIPLSIANEKSSHE